jgi:hypothetical protein
MLAPGQLMLATSPTPDRVEPCHEGDRNRCPVEAGYRQEIVAAPAHICPDLAHRVISLLRSNRVALGVKRTSTSPQGL